MSAVPEATLRRAAAVATLAAVVLPWLNPFAPGPSSAAMPWLFSAACAAVLLLSGPWVDWPRLARLGWLVAALISVGIALVQYLGWSEPFYPWVNLTHLGEAYGNLRQRNQFATLTSMGLAVVLFAAPTRGPWAALALAGAAWLGLGDAASSSRTGLAQLVLLLGLVVVWRHHRSPATLARLLLALTAYAAGAWLLPHLAGLDPGSSGILNRLQDRELACTSRLTLWANVLHLISLRPWLGWGWGELGYAHFITLYPGDRFCDILDNAHNLPLHLAVELGVPLAATICALLLALVWRARPWRESDATRQVSWAVLAVIALHSLLEYPLWYGPFQIAAVVAVLHLARFGRSESDRAQPSVWPAWIAIVLLACVAYATWDYHRVSQIYLNAEERDAAYRDDTLAKSAQSTLFGGHARFAELTLSDVHRANASHIYALAEDLLHFSAEARVAEALIDAALLLGRDSDAAFYLLRFKAAFPQEYARWRGAGTLPHKGTEP